MTIIQSIARTICVAGVSALVLTAIIISRARAEALLTGVNVPNATRAGPADRIAVINQLKAAGVRIARFGINAGDIDYAAQFYAQGIKTDLIVGPQFRPDARAGKPCWVTEWGVGNPSTSCPFDDSPRIPLIAHVIDDFRALVRRGSRPCGVGLRMEQRSLVRQVQT